MAKLARSFAIDTVDEAFTQEGYRIVRSKVFNGGYITRHYGSLPEVEALHIEVRYTVYLDESQLEKPKVPDSDASVCKRQAITQEGL